MLDLSLVDAPPVYRKQERETRCIFEYRVLLPSRTPIAPPCSRLAEDGNEKTTEERERTREREKEEPANSAMPLVKLLLFAARGRQAEDDKQETNHKQQEGKKPVENPTEGKKKELMQ